MSEPADSDREHMQKALSQAREAAELGEVPIGAVIVHEDEVIARAHNLRESEQDPTAHAEMLALRKAAKNLGSWRLEGCTIYVTLEPCPMCAGAIQQARMERLVYGAADPKSGAVDSLYSIPADERLNHQLEVEAGVCADESGRLLREFFADLRG